jgi:hypothetical protein
MRFIFLFCLLFFIATCSAQTLKISPANIDVTVYGSEEKCESVWVYPSSKATVEIFWSDHFSNVPTEYRKTSADIGVEFSYKRYVSGRYDLCFRAKKSGNYYGVTRIIPENSLVAIGNFVALNAVGQNSIYSITGNSIKEIRENNYDLWFIFVLLIVLFCSVLISLIKRK